MYTLSARGKVANPPGNANDRDLRAASTTQPAIPMLCLITLICRMPKPQPLRDAYKAALNFEHLVSLILDGIGGTHPREADELAEYTRHLLRCVRSSNHCVGTRKGQQRSVQAAVWMVEALIILHDLQDSNVQRALVTAAIEVLERVENALRGEGSLPPARD